jgi:hypothetical protein
MREFVNKEVSLDDDQPPFNWAKQIHGIVANPPKGEGMRFDEMKEAIEILDLLEDMEDGDKCMFEEAQYKKVCKRLKEAEFLVAHKEIVVMIDSFLAIEKETPQKE